jgi:hypothetical protein
VTGSLYVSAATPVSTGGGSAVWSMHQGVVFGLGSLARSGGQAIAAVAAAAIAPATGRRFAVMCLRSGADRRHYARRSASCDDERR